MKLAMVLPSPKKADVPKLLHPFNNKGLEFDTIYLCSTERDKILKKDIDADLSVFDNYDLICPIGSEALKYSCGLTGITKYNGMVVEDKFFPIIDPNMLAIKPQTREDLVMAFNKLQDLIEGVVPVTYDKEFKYIDIDEEFPAYLKKMQSVDEIVCDIETTALSPRKGTIIGVALSTEPHEGYFVSSEVIETYMEEMHELFLTKKIIFHNAKFDMAWLSREFGFEFPDFEDTILMHYVLDESVGSHGLKGLAIKYTDLGDYDRALEDYKKKYCRQNKIKLADFNYGMIPTEILSDYACKDADATFQLKTKFFPIIQNNESFSNIYNDILIPATKALMYMEDVGGPVDRDYLEKIEEEYSIDIEECVAEILMDPAVIEFERREDKVFNPNSVFHLRKVFFEILGLKSLKKTETGADSTDAEVLGLLDHPLAEAVLDLRKKVKLSKTYIKNIKENLDFDDRLRSSFNIIGTAAGRLSSSGALNYQNLPRDKDAGIKNMFRARPGYKIIQADLGTAEVYVAAILSKDKFFQQAFIDGLDFHSYVAKNIFKLPCEVDEVKDMYPDERQAAKAITFGIMYGAGPGKIAEEAGVSFDEARSFIKKYFREARDLEAWIHANLNYIKQNCFTYSAFGRKRRLPEAAAPNVGIAKHAERSGLNFLIQSVASDINLLGLIDLVNWVQESGNQKDILPFATVHDSIISEVREDKVDLYCQKVVEFLQVDRGVMIDGCPIKVDCEVGPSWGEVKDYNGYK